MRGEVLRGRSVLVTGAYGLLGSRLTRTLVDLGARVTVLKRDEMVVSALPLEGTENLVNVVRGDVVDPATMQRVMAEYEVEAVFHLAAQTLVGPANVSPVGTYDTNIRGTWTVLEACRTTEVKWAVVASSDKSYGPHDELPYSEDFALRPRHPYEVSKAATDMIGRSYWHTYGLPVAITRFANLYGGGDLNFSRLVPETIVAALRGRSPVIRSDGTAERDFLYVEDAVDAYLAIAELLDSGAPAAGEAFNAGGGVPHSVLEVVELACRAAGSSVQPDIRGKGTPHAEIDRQYVDSSKLHAATGWEPQFDLEAGMGRTVEWYREHLGVIPVN